MTLFKPVAKKKGTGAVKTSGTDRAWRPCRPRRGSPPVFFVARDKR
jgi:hypothetical protein